MPPTKERKHKTPIPPATARDDDQLPKPKSKAHQAVTKSLWFAGHVAILVLGLYLFAVSLLLQKRFLINRVLYRLDFTIIAATYLASVWHYLEGESVRPAVLLAMHSMQFGSIALLWIFMPTHASKTVPFTLISLLHVLDSVSPKLSAQYEKPLSLAVGYSNIMIFFKLLLDFLRIRHGATISIFAYAFFYRIRFQFSSVEQECARNLFDALDTRISADITPEKIRGYWIRTKKRIQNYESVSVAEARKKEEEAIRAANAKM